MTTEKTTIEMTATVSDAIHDGAGGFFAKGDKFHAADEETAKSLREKGLAK